MKKSTGLKKFRTAVFISGKGSNLKSLIKFSKTKQSPISIDFIVSDKSHAVGLKYSDRYNIKKNVFNFKR